MSVLDVAFYVYENLDGTFSFNYCCRNSIAAYAQQSSTARPA